MDTGTSDLIRPTSPAAQNARFEAAMTERMDDLEDENRRLRRLTTMMGVGMAVLLGLTVALMVFSARYGLPGTTASEVAAKQFTLRDPQGNVRGIWGSGNDGSVRLVMQDADGHARVKLNLLGDGTSGVALSDSAGHARAVFALMPDQSASLVFGDATGTSRSVLGFSPDGSATLVFADRNGNTRSGIGIDSRGQGTFTLYDRAHPNGDTEEASAPADSAATAPAGGPPAAPAAGAAPAPNR
jgi:hypothetical protein